jgi:hypothetical protein
VPRLYPMVRTVSAVCFALVLAACDRSTSPGPRGKVEFRLATTTSLAPAAASTSAASALEVTSIRLALFAAALGRGEEFGCINCDGNSDAGPSVAALIDVPLTTPVRVAVEQASLGHYTDVEFSLGTLASGMYPSADWSAETTIEILGRFRGVPFRLALPVTGVFRQALQPNVDVSTVGAASTAQVTITLPVASWFELGGTFLDPNDPAARAQIAANIRRSFVATDSGPSREP